VDSPCEANGNTSFPAIAVAEASEEGGGAMKTIPKRPVPLRRIGPALFRRRSSGQLSTGPDGGLLAVERSGGSTRSGIVDWEPMTPTRTVSGMQWMNSEFIHGRKQVAAVDFLSCSPPIGHLTTAFSGTLGRQLCC
jgi:hypothetical protein